MLTLAMLGKTLDQCEEIVNGENFYKREFGLDERGWTCL